MFNFLKKKLKDTIFGISKKIDEEGQESETEKTGEELEDAEAQEEKEIKERTEKESAEPEKNHEERAEAPPEEAKKEKKSFFSRLKERFSHKKEEPKKAAEEIKEEGFGEVPVKSETDEQPEKEENERKIAEEQEKKESEKKIKEKAEKNAAPAIYKLAQRDSVDKLKEKARKLRKELEEEKREPKEEEIEKIKEEVREIEEEFEEGEKKGFFGKLKEKITTKRINERQFDELFWELEVALLENNVAVEVIEKIKQDLKNSLVETPIKRNKIEEAITSSLKKSIEELFDVEKIDLLGRVKNKRPFVICFFGINGSGKTTTIAKIAQMLKNNSLSCVLAASDTFRAASIEQLQKHADNLQVKLIKHDYGSDPAAVAFDAIKYANAKSIDAVLIDTAGRMHSNVNLIDEMRKIIRVAQPDLKIFVGESITGNDCVEQAQKFNEAVGIDAIVLAKADVDEKGGAAISVSYVTKKPIIYIGTGQDYGDLKEFDSNLIVDSLGLGA